MSKYLDPGLAPACGRRGLPAGGTTSNVTITVVSQAAGTLSHMSRRDFDDDDEYTVTIGEPEPYGTASVGRGDQKVSFRVRGLGDWRSVAFVSADEDGAAIRAVRSLDDRVRLERAETVGRGRSSFRDWSDITDAPHRGAIAARLLAHVEGMSDEELLNRIRGVNRRAAERGLEALARARERHEAQVVVVERAQRRCEALELAGRTQRDIAVRMADAWTGTADQLVQIAAEIAKPVVLPPDTAPPAL